MWGTESLPPHPLNWLEALKTEATNLLFLQVNRVQGARSLLGVRGQSPRENR